MKTVSPWQFALFRIVFGTYLATHFLTLIPYSNELFGHTGIIGDPKLNPAYGIFPNPLNLKLSAIALTSIIAGLVGVSVAFAVGFMRPIASIVLWFGWTALFHRNNLIANPSIPYVGLLLMLCAIIPTGEPLSLSSSKTNWAMPKWVFRCALILLAVGYSFSGFTKLSSPSWVDGTAMTHLLHNPLARPGFIRDGMLILPDSLLALLTWSTLIAELVYLPLTLWKRSRPWIWLTLVLMHFGIMLVVDFADLSWGMLMIHIFTFNPAWLPAKSRNLTLAYDGECLMCSRFIHFIADEDREQRIRFTTLQHSGISKWNSMQVIKDGLNRPPCSLCSALSVATGASWPSLPPLCRRFSGIACIVSSPPAVIAGSEKPNFVKCLQQPFENAFLKNQRAKFPSHPAVQLL